MGGTNKTSISRYPRIKKNDLFDSLVIYSNSGQGTRRSTFKAFIASLGIEIERKLIYTVSIDPSAAITLAADDIEAIDILVAGSTGVNATVTLPDIGLVEIGEWITFKYNSSDFASTLTVNTFGGQLIDGAATKIKGRYGFLSFYSDGTEWRAIDV